MVALDRKMMKLILVFVILCISFSDACSCMPIIPSEAYCNSAFSGTIKVLNYESSSCGTMSTCYTITVIEQFHGDLITPTVLETGTTTCAVELTEGHTYFVAANVINANKIGLNLCQLKEDWTSLPNLEYLVKTWKYGIIRCFPNDISSEISAGTNRCKGVETQ